MRFITRLTLAALVLVSVLGAATIPARAQGDSPLTDEEQALLDRVFAARDVQNGYDNYQEDSTQVYARDTIITYEGQTQTQQQVSDLSRSVVYVQDGATRDFTATLSATETATESQGGQDDVNSLTVNADAVYVEGTLYVNAAYAEPDPALPVLADGWVVVDDPAASEVYSLLDLDNMVENVAMFDDEELVRGAATSVTMEPGTNDDGAAVDVITVNFEGADSGLAVLSGAPDGINPALEAIINASSEVSMTLSVALDADNNPLNVSSTMLITAEGMDGQALAPDQLPEGVLIDVSYDLQQTQVFSAANAEIEPITAPEDLAE